MKIEIRKFYQANGDSRGSVGLVLNNNISKPNYPKWEYKRTFLKYDYQLNEKGLEGWELVCAAQDGMFVGWCIFKRPILTK